MVTLSQKDGAVIIVIENPTDIEKELIQRAKDVLKGESSAVESKKTNTAPQTTNTTSTPQKKSSIWDKFKSPEPKKETIVEPKKEILNFNPEDFEVILDIDEDNIPF